MKNTVIIPLLCIFPLIGCSFVQEREAQERPVSVEEFLQSPILSGATTAEEKEISKNKIVSSGQTISSETDGIWVEDATEEDAESAILESTTDADVEKLVDSLFDSSDF